MKTKTYSTYRSGPTNDPKDGWTTVISDVYTGEVYQMNFTATEQEGRDWAESLINGTPLPNGGWKMPTEDTTRSGSFMYGDDYSPPSRSREEKPVVPVTCYLCGNKVDVPHQWDYFNDDLTLEIGHCGRKETKKFTLTQAKELAKVGWMAFLG
jgi:hypothetical protein